MTELPWIKSYPAGVRWNAELPTTPLQEILEESAKKWADKPALEFMGRRITYRELNDLANRAAKGFQNLGVKPGIHVGLYLPNTPHYVIAFFGIMKAGGTAVNYSPLDAEKVLEHKVEDSQTDFLVTLDLKALYPQMGRLLGKTRLKKLIVGEIAEMTGAPDMVRGQMSKTDQLASVPTDDRHITFQQLLDNDGQYQAYPLGDLKEAIAVLQYTGGTTGLPKGAMLTHANLSAATSQYVESTRTQPPVLEEGKERILAVLPPFHIYALTVNMLLGARLGAELVLHTRFDVEAVVKDITNKKITSFPGVPTMYVAIINYPGIEKIDVSSLKWCASGGAPLPLEVQQRFQEITGCRLAEGWGMTETSPTGTFTPPKGAVKPGSCGIPIPGITIKFANVEDPSKYVPYGEKGEMAIGGPNVMKGYWKKPDATADVMTPDGFMLTGDVGYMDEDGYIYIVDRTKDMLLCGGFNVYPRIIEEAIYKHPSVEEVSVIGIRDEYRGQSPKAFIKLKAGAPTVTFEEMKTFLRDKLGKHEQLGAMEVRAELPKTAVGKLSKKELYEEEARKQAAA
ncbi:MAG TPA: long-chain fatty acid--CoA ligase [Beijerinckiaceae bacterium]|jgi:long-chain acyl-CoA synthetase|nr:long-chain fatty acid--CoA ligase [Beijerinckiaceae bacterium]